MWRRRKSVPEARLADAVDRIETLADDLEEHNRLLANLSPTVGLYQTFEVNTGQGLVDCVLYDLEFEPSIDGRPKLVAGRIMDRSQFDVMMSPSVIAQGCADTR